MPTVGHDAAMFVGQVFRRRSSWSATQTAATIPTKHWTAKTSPAAFAFLVAPCIDWQTRDEGVGLSPSVRRLPSRRLLTGSSGGGGHEQPLVCTAARPSLKSGNGARRSPTFQNASRNVSIDHGGGTGPGLEIRHAQRPLGADGNSLLRQFCRPSRIW